MFVATCSKYEVIATVAIKVEHTVMNTLEYAYVYL